MAEGKFYKKFGFTGVGFSMRTIELKSVRLFCWVILSSAIIKLYDLLIFIYTDFFAISHISSSHTFIGPFDSLYHSIGFL